MTAAGSRHPTLGFPAKAGIHSSASLSYLILSNFRNSSVRSEPCFSMGPGLRQDDGKDFALGSGGP
jgi:hypothetical protein